MIVLEIAYNVARKREIIIAFVYNILYSSDHQLFNILIFQTIVYEKMEESTALKINLDFVIRLNSGGTD